MDVVSQPGQSPLDITVLDPSDIGALFNLTGTLTVGLDDGVGTCPPCNGALVAYVLILRRCGSVGPSNHLVG